MKRRIDHGRHGGFVERAAIELVDIRRNAFRVLDRLRVFHNQTSDVSIVDEAVTRSNTTTSRVPLQRHATREELQELDRKTEAGFEQLVVNLSITVKHLQDEIKKLAAADRNLEKKLQTLQEPGKSRKSTT